MPAETNRAVSARRSTSPTGREFPCGAQKQRSKSPTVTTQSPCVTGVFPHEGGTEEDETRRHEHTFIEHLNDTFPSVPLDP